MTNQQVVFPSGEEDRFVSAKEAALFTGLGASTLSKLRTAGSGPRFARTAGRVLYSLSELRKWMESQTIQSTAQGKPRFDLRRKATPIIESGKANNSKG